MSHCYASRDLFYAFLADTGADQYHGSDPLVLSILEASSFAVDDYCRRTGRDHPMSGFGPRLGVNWYDVTDPYRLEFDDDLIAATNIAIYPDGPLGAAITPVELTNFNLRPYSRVPKRSMEMVIGNPILLTPGPKYACIVGTWGYQDVRRPLAAVVGAGDWTIGGTSLLVSDAGEFSAGMTFWCGTEALYVTDVEASTITVVRAMHGTTAATHTAAAALTTSVYPSDVVSATLMIATKRWKGRDAGVAGESYGGGGGLPLLVDRAGERAILRATMWGKAMENAG